jgi:hypothetical protein
MNTQFQSWLAKLPAPHLVNKAVRRRFGMLPFNMEHAVAKGLKPFEQAPTKVSITSSLPTSVSLDPFGPKQHYDQGQHGSCGGHGTCGALATVLRHLGVIKPTDPDPSPRSCYALLRSLMGMAGQLSDSGIDSSVVMDAVEKWGWEFMGALVQDGVDPTPRYSDCGDTNINVDLVVEDFESSIPKVVTGLYLISATDITTRLNQICTALAHNWPVMHGQPCGDSYEAAFTNGTPVPAQNLDDPNTGGHWTYTRGYRTVNGVVIPRDGNSWGDTGGLNGDIDSTPNFVSQWDTLIVLQVGA